MRGNSCLTDFSQPVEDAAFFCMKLVRSVYLLLAACIGLTIPLKIKLTARSDLNFNIFPFCFTGPMLQLSCSLAYLG